MIPLLTLACGEKQDEDYTDLDCFDSGDRENTPYFEETRYVKINLIDIVDSNGEGQLSYRTIEERLNALNDAFEPINIQFFIPSDQYITLVEDDTLFTSTANSDDTEDLYNDYHIDSVINVILVNDLENENAGGVCRNCDGMMESAYIVIPKEDDDSRTWIHEMGHFFGLQHTFYNRDELVDGSNCENAGDYLCDTEADPGNYPDDPLVSYCEVDECTLVSCPDDSNGDPYQPNIENAMSYYVECAIATFTSEQYDVMNCYARMNDDLGHLIFETTEPTETLSPMEKIYTNCDWEPESADTIPQAFSRVAEGGIIEICEGSYETNISLLNFDVTLRGYENDTVILSGENSHTVINSSFSNLELDNLTISSSSSNEDAVLNFAAVTVYSGSLVARDLVFSNNLSESTTAYSSALSLNNVESASIADSSFENNTSGRGGAIYIANAAGSTTIDNCYFNNNTAEYNGNAIWIYQSDVEVLNSTFTDHSSSTAYGTIYTRGASLSIRDTSFNNNTSFNGSAIYHL